MNTDTDPCAYTHIHTFISHWKRQDQRRKEEQTPLRCWAWLHVPLDTGGRTQDNCCLLFMEGPSATLHALFIWRLLKGHSQGPQKKRKMKLTMWVHIQLLYECSVCDPVYCICVNMNAFLFAYTVVVYSYCTVLDPIIHLNFPHRDCVVCSAGVGSVKPG